MKAFRKQVSAVLPGMAVPQRRRARREPRDLYDAVVQLRRAGHRVYRAGRDMSLLDGKRVTNAALARLAVQSGP